MDRGKQVEEKVFLSVIITTYNSSKYLDRCIKSVLEQKFDGLEIIVIDDASTDDSYEKIKAYQLNNPEIRLYRNDRNMQSGYSKNRGISLIRGEYFCVLDSDDWIADGCLIKLYEFAKKDGADLLVYKMRRTRIEDFCEKTVVNELKVYKDYSAGSEFLEEMLDNHRMAVSGCRYFLKASSLREDVRFAQGTLNDDFLYTICLLLTIGRVVELNNELYYYVDRGEGSLTASIKKRSIILEIISFVETILSRNYSRGDVKKKSIERKALRALLAFAKNDYYSNKHNSAKYFNEALGKVENNPTLLELWNETSSCLYYNGYNSDRLEQLKSYKRIYIYGAGVRGTDLMRFLKENGVHVDGFIVSNIGNNVSENMVVPTIEIANVIPEDTMAILIGVSSKYKWEIIDALESYKLGDKIFEL